MDYSIAKIINCCSPSKLTPAGGMTARAHEIPTCLRFQTVSVVLGVRESTLDLCGNAGRCLDEGRVRWFEPERMSDVRRRYRRKLQIIDICAQWAAEPGMRRSGKRSLDLNWSHWWKCRFSWEVNAQVDPEAAISSGKNIRNKCWWMFSLGCCFVPSSISSFSVLKLQREPSRSLWFPFAGYWYFMFARTSSNRYRGDLLHGLPYPSVCLLSNPMHLRETDLQPFLLFILLFPSLNQQQKLFLYIFLTKYTKDFFSWTVSKFVQNAETRINIILEGVQWIAHINILIVKEGFFFVLFVVVFFQFEVKLPTQFCSAI